jgi:hypothetical protein
VPSSRRIAGCLCRAALALLVAGAAAAQDGDTLAYPKPPSEDPRAAGQRAQAEFERFRRLNLPRFDGRRPSGCQEQVGRFCYWYDEGDSTLPRELERVTQARDRLLRTLDSLGTLQPGDNWINGQRVRYHLEAGRPDAALRVAESCRSYGWWCDAITGLALHELRRYPEAEAAYARVLAAVTPRERCAWRDLTPYLDDETRRRYNRTSCGSPEREAFEDRTWWLARTRYGMAGNDSRTEHYARLTYVELVRHAPSAHPSGFDESERELLVRFGWQRGWSQDGYVRSGGNDPADRVNVIGHEQVPAYRFIPPSEVLQSPATSDSTEWAVQLPPVIARYHPPYAARLYMLEHQQALFRRGDTALVALAWDVTRTPGIAGVPLEAALVLTTGATPGAMPEGHVAILRDAPARGTLTARAPWGPLLMSAEVEAEGARTLVRARYGIRPPWAIGTRVSLSDLLFYRPYGDFPATVEEALPHALATQKVRASDPLGVYWEAYDTDPAGEPMRISLTVVPETEETGFLARTARALRLSREAQPISVGVEDRSAFGRRMTPRALQLDISTLQPGEYLVQLEIEVAGQYVVRADRRLVVTGK